MNEHVLTAIGFAVLLVLAFAVSFWPRRRRLFVQTGEDAVIGLEVAITGGRMPDGSRRAIEGYLTINTGDRQTNRSVKQLYRDIEPAIAAAIREDVSCE